MLINRILFGKALMRALFPRRCFGCKKKDFWICEKCLSTIRHADDPPHSWITALFSYKDPIIKKTIWALKFQGRFSVLEDLGRYLTPRFKDFLSLKRIEKDTSVIVPIPQSLHSKKTRSYNQSALIAELVADGYVVDKHTLRSIGHYVPQNKIKERHKRLTNVIGSFTVQEKSTIEGLTIILIDDVVTTGATLKEARGVLLDAGAKKVYGFTIAH